MSVDARKLPDGDADAAVHRVQALPTRAGIGVDPGPSHWLVACLCAEWCGACRGFRADFDAVRARYPAARFAWVDIEDHPDVLGDDDVDTFPTLLIVDGTGRGFLGPIEPRASTLLSLVDGALRGDHERQTPSPRLAQIASAVQAVQVVQGAVPPLPAAAAP